MNIDSLQTGAPSQSVKPRPVLQTPEASRSIVPATDKAPDQGITKVQQKELTVEDAVKRISNFVSKVNSEISFSIDDASGVSVVKIIDSQSKEIIRQFPSEEAIQIAHALDKLQGVFVKEKA